MEEHIWEIICALALTIAGLAAWGALNIKNDRDRCVREKAQVIVVLEKEQDAKDLAESENKAAIAFIARMALLAKNPSKEFRDNVDTFLKERQGR